MFDFFKCILTFKILQVKILLRELCRLHNVSLPNDLDNLMLPLQLPPELMCNYSLQNQQQPIDDSDPDEIEDVVGESETESEGDEDIPLEMDDGRNANKVISLYILIVG